MVETELTPRSEIKEELEVSMQQDTTRPQKPAKTPLAVAKSPYTVSKASNTSGTFTLSSNNSVSDFDSDSVNSDVMPRSS